MKVFTPLQVQRLDQLVSQENTGTPKELSRKLGLTEPALLKLIHHLRNDLGYPIGYSRNERTYYYCKGSDELFH